MAVPDQHFKSMKEADEKLKKTEKQLIEAEIERKKLVIDN